MENPDIVQVEQIEGAQDKVALNEDVFVTEILEISDVETHSEINNAVQNLLD